MNRIEAQAKLKAWEEGRPQPLGSTLALPRAPDPCRLVVAFVRMAGESTPWGVAIGKPGDTPMLFIATEPRDRDQTSGILLGFGTALLSYLRHPSTLDAAQRAQFDADRAQLRAKTDRLQVWLPGSSHLDMLHFIDYRCTLAANGDDSHVHQLRTIGRACGWLFREATRPGQVRVFDATARLRQAFCFPAEEPRQAHLGFLLAWLDGSLDKQGRIAAARKAEQLSSGITMDPAYEREVLEPLLMGYQKTRGTPAEASFVEKVREAIAPELIRRWNHVVDAIRVFDGDPRASNPYLRLIEECGSDEFVRQFWEDELRAYDLRLPLAERRPRGSHPESDFQPTKAAFRYFMHLHAHELVTSEFVHGDQMLLEQAIEEGNAFRGTVKSVLNVSKTRAIKAVWTIECPSNDSLRLREESSVCIAGERKRKGKIINIENTPTGRLIAIEITEGKTGDSVSDGVDAHDEPALVGRTVVWLDDREAGLSQRKSTKLGDGGPGAWLTHATPSPEPSPPAVVRPDLLNFVESLR